jgi:hypothetical protein
MTDDAIRKPRRREQVLATRVEEQIALFDVDVGTYYGLNQVGAGSGSSATAAASWGTSSPSSVTSTTSRSTSWRRM